MSSNEPAADGLENAHARLLERLDRRLEDATRAAKRECVPVKEHLDFATLTVSYNDLRAALDAKDAAIRTLRADLQERAKEVLAAQGQADENYQRATAAEAKVAGLTERAEKSEAWAKEQHACADRYASRATVAEARVAVLVEALDWIAWRHIGLAEDRARAALSSSRPAGETAEPKPYAYAWRYAGEVAWHLSFEEPKAMAHHDLEYRELFLAPSPAPVSSPAAAPEPPAQSGASCCERSNGHD